MKNLVRSYLHDEDAIDDAVSKMMFVVIAICCAMAVGWFIWNTLQSKTEKTSCKNSNSPWCTE